MVLNNTNQRDQATETAESIVLPICGCTSLALRSFHPTQRDSSLVHSASRLTGIGLASNWSAVAAGYKSGSLFLFANFAPSFCFFRFLAEFVRPSLQKFRSASRTCPVAKHGDANGSGTLRWIWGDREPTLETLSVDSPSLYHLVCKQLNRW